MTDLILAGDLLAPQAHPYHDYVNPLAHRSPPCPVPTSAA